MDNEIEKLVKENNELLHKMHNAQVRGKIYRVIYWLIIIVLAIAAFYFIQPYVERVQTAYDSFDNVRENAGEGNLSEEDLSRLLESVQ